MRVSVCARLRGCRRICRVARPDLGVHGRHLARVLCTGAAIGAVSGAILANKGTNNANKGANNANQGTKDTIPATHNMRHRAQVWRDVAKGQLRQLQRAHAR